MLAQDVSRSGRQGNGDGELLCLGLLARDEEPTLGQLYPRALESYEIARPQARVKAYDDDVPKP